MTAAVISILAGRAIASGITTSELRVAPENATARARDAGSRQSCPALRRGRSSRRGTRRRRYHLGHIAGPAVDMGHL